MLRKGLRVKVIVVLEFESLRADGGKSITDVANRLLDLFLVDWQRMINSVMLVVSKVNTAEFKLEEVISQIKNIVRNRDNISDEA